MTKTAVLSAKLTPDRRAKLDRLASRTGRSRNSIINELIDLVDEEPVAVVTTTYTLAVVGADG